MAGNFVILPELRLTITKIYGVITDSDIEYLQGNLVADEKFSPSFDRLTDCRDVAINNVSHEIIKKFGQIIGESKNIKRVDLYAREVEKESLASTKHTLVHQWKTL